MKKKVSVVSRHPSHKNFDLPQFNKSVRVRFGSLTDFPARKDIEFPTKDAIRITSSKIKMKKAFDLAGVSSPVWGEFNISVINSMIDSGVISESLAHMFHIVDGKVEPIAELIYKEANHSRGEGIEFIKTNEDLMRVLENGKHGYIEFIVGNEREFRVHVCDGEAFYIDEKRPRESGHTARIKNLANGYKYREPKKEYPDLVKSEAVKAVNAIGIDFGAVDVSLSEDGVVTVFEVNSAPGLRSRTRKLYREQIIKLIIKKGAEIVE